MTTEYARGRFDPPAHHTYTARNGIIFDRDGRPTGTARTADGDDLERFELALKEARRQRAQLATIRNAIGEMAETTPRPFEYGYPTHPQHGYELEIAGAEQPVQIVPTDRDHVHVATPSGARTVYTHRGRPYHVHFSQHVYRHPDGTWSLEHPDPEQNEPRNGAGRLYGADELPSPAGRQKFQAAILEAVQAWTAEHAEELERADAAALNNAAGRREERIRDAARELAAALDELQAIDAADPLAPRY